MRELAHTRIAVVVFILAASFGPLLLWEAATRPIMAKAAVPDGAKIYQNTCGRCHNAPDPRQRSPQSWQTIMPHMRVRGGLTADQAEAVLTFLKEQAQPPLPTREPGAEGARVSVSSVEAGRKLFDNLNCLACHTIAGKGGQVGPPLDAVGSRRTREQLSARMRARRAGEIMPTLPPDMPDEQINQLVDYLTSLEDKSTK